MKKIFSISLLLCAMVMNGQSRGYNDLGIIFSDQDTNGTARFESMSGAFGALGGDLSAIEINPAGGAVLLKSELAASINFRNGSVNSKYYGNNSLFEDNYTNLSQAGAVLVFESGNSKWTTTAVGINYTMSKDFDSNWAASGNSNYPTFIYDDNYTDDGDDTNDILYLNSDGQSFENFTDGKNEKITLSFGSQYSDKLYVGASFSSQDLSYYQSVYLVENNNDGTGNSIQGSLFEELSTVGNGIKLNIGFISKATDNLRLGMAYESPTWYSLTEEFNDGNGINGFDYTLKSPSKVTGSAAYIFNENGLVSLDYAMRNYGNIKLGPTIDFNEENAIFKNDLKNTSEIRLGTEWRVERTSFRGGYHFKQNPYNNSPSSDNLSGYSLGVGYDFGKVKLDISYKDSNRTDIYDFYPQYSEVKPVQLDIDNSSITGTLVIDI